MNKLRRSKKGQKLWKLVWVFLANAFLWAFMSAYRAARVMAVPFIWFIFLDYYPQFNNTFTLALGVMASIGGLMYYFIEEVFK